MNSALFSAQIKPDGEEFIKCVRRQGTPKRVHFIELFLDLEIQDVIVQKYGLDNNIYESDPFFMQKKLIAIQRFLGYDYVTAGVGNIGFAFTRIGTSDTSLLKKNTGMRFFAEEHKGPVTTWEEFEKFQWPDLPRQTPPNWNGSIKICRTTWC